MKFFIPKCIFPIATVATLSACGSSSLPGGVTGNGNVALSNQQNVSKQKKVSKLTCDSLAEVDPPFSRDGDKTIWSKTFDFDLKTLPKGKEVPCDDGISECYEMGGFSNESVDKFGNKYAIQFQSSPDEKYWATMQIETPNGQGGYLNVGLGSHKKDIVKDNFSQLSILGKFDFDSVKYKGLLLSCRFE